MIFVRRLFALVILVTVLAGATVPVEAARRGISDDALVAGYYFAEILDLIITRYRGDPVNIEQLLGAALLGMTDQLDQYSTYLSARELAELTASLAGRFIGIGVSMLARDDGRIEITRVFPDSPAEGAGVMPGDIIVSIDGVSVDGMTLAEISYLLVNSASDEVVIGFERDGNVIDFDITKAEVRSPTVTVSRFEDIREAGGLDGLQNYRYMQINTVGLTTGDDVRKAISQMLEEGVQGVVIDLRGNTGGYLEVTKDIANQLIPQGVILQTVNYAGQRRVYTSYLQDVPFDNVVVLVNRFTASAAEVIASALQDSGAAVIVGETTFGKGLVQSVYVMRSGGALKLTTEEYFRRSGGTINGVGVTPCVLVERRRSSSERDHVLYRGIRILADS